MHCCVKVTWLNLNGGLEKRRSTVNGIDLSYCLDIAVTSKDCTWKKKKQRTPKQQFSSPVSQSPSQSQSKQLPISRHPSEQLQQALLLAPWKAGDGTTVNITAPRAILLTSWKAGGGATIAAIVITIAFRVTWTTAASTACAHATRIAIPSLHSISRYRNEKFGGRSDNRVGRIQPPSVDIVDVKVGHWQYNMLTNIYMYIYIYIFGGGGGGGEWLPPYAPCFLSSLKYFEY